MSPRRVTVRVPATSANLGPGFDCLALALDFYNTVTAALSDQFSIAITGEGAIRLSRGADNQVYRAIATLYSYLGLPLPRLSLRCHNEVPLGRGLGSSGAAVVGGLVAANLLCGEPLSPQEILGIAEQMEGHPDNAAAALFGGCQIVMADSAGGLWTTPVPLQADVRFALLIPDFEMSTASARAVLPSQVGRAEAIFNLGRVATLVTAFATGDLRLLREATKDRLHQPQRRSLFPAMEAIFEAALEAGALGVCLSGSGPTVLAFTQERVLPVAEAMSQAAHQAGLRSTIRLAGPSLQGAHLVSAE